jgi:V8-like Glu-specific endopeptidase
LLKSVEETCNSTSTEMLQNEDLVSLEKYIKEFPSSNVYTLPSSSKEPLTDNDRKIMTKNVKSSAYKTLLSPNKSKIHANNEKFVNKDQQIINFANDDLYKNATTKIPARLLESLGKNMKSIGQISCGNVRGTCWLVIDMLVMTNLHVYKQFDTEREDRQNRNLPITVSFDYLHPGQREHVVTVEVDEVQGPRLENSYLDYIFLHLKENEGLRGRDPLGPLVRSRSLQDGLVIILGHPAGSEMHVETCVVVSSHSWREKLQQRHQAVSLHMTNDDLLMREYQNQGCLPYDTSLFSGASGSPVFDVNGNIIAMHTQGYTLEAQEGNVSLMEFGVQFNAICEDMRLRNLVDQYFPNYNLGTGEERMDEA